MNAKHPVRFDLDALRAVAGDKVFARGQDYHGHGEVEILAIDAHRVLAQVAGTEDYRVELTGRGKTIGGTCSCPAYGNWGFCKHMVATALAANTVGTAGEAEGSRMLPRIRAHLKAKGKDALVDLILDLAERDATLLRRLDLAAVAVSADDKKIEARLRKALDDATRTRGFVEYDEVGGWASGVEAVLEAVAEVAQPGRAKIAMDLAEHAIDRIERALDEIDDSNGECGGLLMRACEIHLDAARIVRPDPVRLAEELFTREIDGDYDAFYGAAMRYADVLGDAGLAEYRRLATAAWDKLPPRSGGTLAHQTYDGSYHYLASILDGLAERDGDLDTRIAIRSKDLSSPWAYLQLAEFYMAHGRDGEALRRAEEGLWLFEDARLDERLVFFTATLLSKHGRKADAAVLLQKTFEKAPSLQVYHRLRQIGGAAVVERLVGVLERRCVTDAGLHNAASADLLIDVLMLEKAFDAAWRILHQYGASPRIKEALADACGTSHPAEALPIYAERVEALVRVGTAHSYGQAMEFIARMAPLRSPAEHAGYIASLKERFGRKRNLMKLLP